MFSEVRDKQISTLSQFRGMSGTCFVFHNVYPIDSDFKRIFANLDPVVQSIVSLTISLRHNFVKQISA